jgi:uncharacterized cupin superfamily protein
MRDYIIKKSEIETMQGLQKEHFLNANAQRTNKSLGDMTGLTGFGFHIIEVPPGKQSTELHRHYHEDECVYVLAGYGEATIADTAFAIEAGDFIGYRAGGLAHTLTNTGTQTLRCIVVGARLAHDVGEYPNLNKRLYRNPGMAWELVDIDDISNPTAGRKI